jgi:hypothetical protein
VRHTALKADGVVVAIIYPDTVPPFNIGHPARGSFKDPSNPFPSALMVRGRLNPPRR